MLRVGAAYLAVSWLIIQVAQTVFPAFGLGATTVRLVIVVLVIGLLPVLIFAWAFEITPEGLKRESEFDRNQSATPQTGKKLDRVIIGVLALALGYFAVDKFVLAPQREQAATEAGRAEGRTESLVKSYGENSIAVLPFIDLSPNKDQEYFSDGISEELLNLLAKIPKLRVISRSSAFSYKGKDVKLAQVAKELNVAHILEGSVREARAALTEMQKEPEEIWRLLGLPMVYHTLGRKADSDVALAELTKKYSADAAYNIANVLAWRNERDRAFEWLDKAVTQQDPALSEITFDPLFANLHGDPRWLPFLRKIGKAPEQLAAIKFDVKVPQ